MFGEFREAFYLAAGLKSVQVLDRNARDQFDPPDYRAGLKAERRLRPEIVARFLP